MLATHGLTLEKALCESRVGFELNRVTAARADHWLILDGALQHKSKGFFSVTGVKFGAPDSACVMLYQPQTAITGLISARVDGERRFLLQARAEPGCIGEAQFGPTVQSTPANFMRIHGGAKPAYVDTLIEFDPNISLLDDTTQLDLGARYLFKSKRSIFAEAHSPPPPQRGFIWATRQAIYEAVRRSAFLNIDLRSILSIASWSAHEEDGELTPEADLVRRSLSAPIRPQIVGDVLSALARTNPPVMRFVPLEALENWCITEWGISERVPRQRFSVDFFEVRTPLREVDHWVQPLVNSASKGHVVLACRERHKFLEFFIRPIGEHGLATGAALAPSYLRYPGAIGEPPEWLSPHLSNVWAESEESDEGGRFYRDSSVYQVVVCGDDEAAPPDKIGCWLRLSELKLFLEMSNTCTIQLRGVSSHLISVR